MMWADAIGIVVTILAVILVTRRRLWHRTGTLACGGQCVPGQPPGTIYLVGLTRCGRLGTSWFLMTDSSQKRPAIRH